MTPSTFKHPLSEIAVAITEERKVVSLERYRREVYRRQVEAALAEANAELDRLEKMIGREQV